MSWGFYDFQGVWRKNGDWYLDFKNVYRSPNDMFLDARGIYRKPGDYFYDSEDLLRAPGGVFRDAIGAYRSHSITKESVIVNADTKPKQKKTKETPNYEKVKVESLKEMKERIKKQAEEDKKNGKLINISEDNSPPLTPKERKKLYFKHYFIFDLKEALGNIFIFLFLCLIFMGISYLLTIVEYKELFISNPYKLLYIPTIIAFILLILIMFLYSLKKYFDNSFKSMYLIMTPIAIILLEIFGWTTYNTIEKIFLPLYGFAVSLIPCAIIYLIRFIKYIIKYPPYK